jgi:hypothetical protein
MYKLIEIPEQSNDFIAKFENVETNEIISLHRREYRGNITLNQFVVNLETIKK